MACMSHSRLVGHESFRNTSHWPRRHRATRIRKILTLAVASSLLVCAGWLGLSAEPAFASPNNFGHITVRFDPSTARPGDSVGFLISARDDASHKYSPTQDQTVGAFFDSRSLSFIANINGTKCTVNADDSTSYIKTVICPETPGKHAVTDTFLFRVLQNATPGTVSSSAFIHYEAIHIGASASLTIVSPRPACPDDYTLIRGYCLLNPVKEIAGEIVTDDGLSALQKVRALQRALPRMALKVGKSKALLFFSVLAKEIIANEGHAS